jgi:hypothetical protein
VNEEAGHVDDPHDLASSRKDVLERTLVKAISQKGDNMYQVCEMSKSIAKTARPTTAFESGLPSFISLARRTRVMRA